MNIDSSRFGKLEVEDCDILNFPVGIPGFEDKHGWILVGDDDNAIMWMQSVEDGALALPITTPDAVCPGYNAQIPRETLEALGTFEDLDLATLIVVTIPPNSPWEMTANLKAPIIINRAERIGIQVIALNEDYEFRRPVLDEPTREQIRAQAAASGGE